MRLQRLAENDEPGKVAAVDLMSRSMTEFGLQGPRTMSTVSTPESTASERFSTSIMSTPDNDKKESGYFSTPEAEPKVATSTLYMRFVFYAGMPDLGACLKLIVETIMLRPSPLATRKGRPLQRVERELRQERAASAVHCPRPSNMSERAKRYAALPIAVFGEHLVNNEND